MNIFRLNVTSLTKEATEKAVTSSDMSVIPAQGGENCKGFKKAEITAKILKNNFKRELWWAMSRW